MQSDVWGSCTGTVFSGKITDSRYARPLSINSTQHCNTQHMHKVSHFCCYGEFPYAEFSYAELFLYWVSLCGVSLYWVLLCWVSLCWVLLCQVLLCWVSLCRSVIAPKQIFVLLLGSSKLCLPWFLGKRNTNRNHPVCCDTAQGAKARVSREHLLKEKAQYSWPPWTN